MLIDSHCHLQNLPPEERERGARRAPASAACTVSSSRPCGSTKPRTSSPSAIATTDVWCALGVHPHDASTWKDGDDERLRALLADPKAVAVGECGLDFFYDHSPRDVQERVFRAQWSLALELGLPVVVHNRDSNDAMLAVLERARLPRPARPTSTPSPAASRWPAELIARGFCFGISGMITFPKADNVREVLPGSPADRLLVETDTPYLAPVPYRGKPNEPAYVVEIAERLAKELSVEVQELSRTSEQAFLALFAKAREGSDRG